MSNEASSEQSCVCKGVGYDEVFLLGQGDPDTFYDERDLSANSPSMEDEYLDVDELKADSNDDDIDLGDPPI